MGPLGLTLALWGSLCLPISYSRISLSVEMFLIPLCHSQGLSPFLEGCSSRCTGWVLQPAGAPGPGAQVGVGLSLPCLGRKGLALSSCPGCLCRGPFQAWSWCRHKQWGLSGRSGGQVQLPDSCGYSLDTGLPCRRTRSRPAARWEGQGKHRAPTLSSALLVGGLDTGGRRAQPAEGAVQQVQLPRAAGGRTHCQGLGLAWPTALCSSWSGSRHAS